MQREGCFSRHVQPLLGVVSGPAITWVLSHSAAGTPERERKKESSCLDLSFSPWTLSFGVPTQARPRKRVGVFEWHYGGWAVTIGGEVQRADSERCLDHVLSLMH